MKVLVTGSSGLIGSEAVSFFCAKGYDVRGVDNNMRRDFFGPEGDTTGSLRRLQRECPTFRSSATDIRDRAAMFALFQEWPPDLVIHCAAQPSHDLAAQRPLDDFDVNAVGTLNLLEACRRHSPDAVFILMSTNKVYGDAPNEIPLVEKDTRWDYANPEDWHGVREDCRIDRSLHSVFGASKVAADVLTQEYGRYFGMKTAAFRGGCLTGPRHAGVELHGFLSYIFKAASINRKYRIFGYKGKQVRDQIHSYDVCRAFEEFARNPRPGAVYNLGGGRENSASILETIELVERHLGKELEWEYVDQARKGDHICYISDLRAFQRDYPGWRVTVPLDEICRQIAESLVPA
jgi:CDP-paratose 2-epimerase